MKRLVSTADVARIISRLAVDLDDLTAGEKCDHSVGICWCGVKHDIDDAVRWLKEHDHGYLALHLVKKLEVTNED